MAEITPVYIAKHNDKIESTNASFSEVSEKLYESIWMDDTMDIECIINDHYDGYEIGDESYTAYEIAENMNIENEVFEKIVRDYVENMNTPHMGNESTFGLDEDYVISKGLQIIDDKGETHIIDTEFIQLVSPDNPVPLIATDDTKWRVGMVDDEYVIMQDDPKKECYIYIMRIQSGIPTIAGVDSFDNQKDYEARLVELCHEANGKLLNQYEEMYSDGEEKIIATIYL